MISNRFFYPETWQSFLDLDETLATHTLDAKAFYDWHQGRDRFYFLALELNHAQLEQKLQHYRTGLKDFLLQDYKRKTHITIFALGFIGENSNGLDQITFIQLDGLESIISDLNLKPFDLKVGGVNSFQSAPILEVQDKTQSLTKIRNKLVETFHADRDVSFVPHVTLGLYRENYPVQPILNAVADLEEIANEALLEDINLTMDTVSLFSYSVQNLKQNIKKERDFCFLS